MSEESTKLSTGSRVYQSAFDPAGKAIATGMNARSVSNAQVQRNVNDGISLLQVAEGTLGVLHNISGRLRELAMQAANDTVGDAERAVADREFQEMAAEAKRLVSSTKFNGNHIINGQGSVYDLQIGLDNDPAVDRLRYDLKKVLDSAGNFGLTGQNIRSKQAARDTFSTLDKMINEVSSSRAKLGGAMNRMTSTIENLRVHKENIDGAKSVIADNDVAVSTTKNAINEIKKNATTSMLMQANVRPSAAVKLIDASA